MARTELVAAACLAAGFALLVCGDRGSTSTPRSVSAAPLDYDQVVLHDDPRAFYKLDERAGPTAADASGNGRNGTYFGTYRLGGPALLNGENSTSASFPKGYVRAPATLTKPAVTAECWIRPTAADLQGAPRILNNAWTDHDGHGFMLWLSDGTAAFNTGWSSEAGDFGLAAGNVYHLVGTYDAPTGVRLYINGQQVAHSTPGFVPKPQIADFGDLTYIGALDAEANGGLTDYFAGDVADCAVYDHVLTAAQVATHYNAGSGEHIVSKALQTTAPTPPPPPPTPLPNPLTYDAHAACIAGKLYENSVLPAGEGEFSSNGFDRGWWGRPRGNPIGGRHYSGFQMSWGRHQYDTYFGDPSDGLGGGYDPFYSGADVAAPGAPRGVRIAAMPMPSDLVGNPAVDGANWYSGVLDTPIDARYGFFVARVRLPRPKPGMSPAWWLLTNDGTPRGPRGPRNGEWDVQELFGNDFGEGMNAGTILWNSGTNKPQNWGGTYDWPTWERTTPSQDYHDYGALIGPGGVAISDNDYGPGGPGYVYGRAGSGVTNYLDGIPLYGHTGGADVTSGVSWKELMVMFQVGAKGGWLGTPNPADFPAYYWIQWIRVYKPTATPC